MYMSKERSIALAILNKSALSFNDIIALRGYIFETGIASREEAEMLMAVDRSPSALAPGWAAFFIEAITDFIVWQQRPTGRVTESDLDWLTGCLGDQPTANGKALIFNIVREAHESPSRMSEVVMRFSAAG